jgi:hypothetical protein
MGLIPRISKVAILLFFLAAFIPSSGSRSRAAEAGGSATGISPDRAFNVVQGYEKNSAAIGVTGATISGGGQLGFPNRVIGRMGTIGGGMGNLAGELAAVGGGAANRASGLRATIGGGAQNMADRDSATIAGGFANTASASFATVSGGTFNSASEINATVGGGAGNSALERDATVSGGTENQTSGYAGTIGGGVYNKALATYTTISGGIANAASGIEASVNGGAGNKASGEGASISGGMNNHASDQYCTVGGGRANRAGSLNEDPVVASYATVGGGDRNAATGSFAVIPGGSSNTAAAPYSFAAGRRASILKEHTGAFLFADSKDSKFLSAAPNEFAVRATGGIRLVTAVDASGTPTSSVRVSPGSGTWESLCDRNAKTFHSSADCQKIAEGVARLPIAIWSYKEDVGRIKHIGPAAQDFYETFALGVDDKHISTVDGEGVALAAIQFLYKRLQGDEIQMEKQQRFILRLETEIISLQDRLRAFENRTAALPPDSQQ